MDELVSVEEAGRRLGGISKHTINSWLSSKKLKRTKIGRRTMISQSEIQKFIDAGGSEPSIVGNRRRATSAPEVGA